MNYKEFKKLVESCKHDGVKKAFLKICRLKKAADLIDLRALKRIFESRWAEINRTPACYTMNQEHPVNAAYIIIAEGLASRGVLCPLGKRKLEFPMQASGSGGDTSTWAQGTSSQMPVGTYGWLMPSTERDKTLYSASDLEEQALNKYFVDDEKKIISEEDLLVAYQEYYCSFRNRSCKFFTREAVSRLFMQFPSLSASCQPLHKKKYSTINHITEKTIAEISKLSLGIKDIFERSKKLFERSEKLFEKLFKKKNAQLVVRDLDKMSKPITEFKKYVEQCPQEERVQIYSLQLFRNSKPQELSWFFEELRENGYTDCMREMASFFVILVGWLEHLKGLNEIFEIKESRPSLGVSLPPLFLAGKETSTLRNEAEGEVEQAKCCPCFW